MNLFTRYKWTHTQGTNVLLPKEKGGEGGINQEFGIGRHTPIYKINNKDLQYSTGNYTQQIIINYNGKKGYITCVSESLCCTSETDTTL